VWGGVWGKKKANEPSGSSERSSQRHARAIVCAFTPKGDAVFARILDGLRKGVVTDEAHKVLNERAFHTATFASTEEMRDPVSGLRPTEIYPTNEEADAVNQREFDKLCASDASKRIPVYTFRDIRIEETKEARPIFDAYIANMQKDSLVGKEHSWCKRHSFPPFTPR
jgi:hypothetical protein